MRTASYRHTFVILFPALLFCLGMRQASVPRNAGRQKIQTAREVPVVGSLQAAVNAAQPGDVLLLQATTYTGQVDIERAGQPGAPIVIRGAGRGATVLAGKLVFGTAAAHWTVENMDVNAAGDDDGIRINAPAHDITIRQVHLYGGQGYGVRVGTDVYAVLIEDCEIDHFDAGDSDAHGIGIMTASDVIIRRCDIHDNSGDAIQVNTPDYPGYGRWASQIWIENNQLHECRENALDIKSTHGLTARFNRMWGFHAVDNSDGMAVQVQYDAQDITLWGNQIWDAVEGIEISRGSKSGQVYPLAPLRVTIVGNWLHDFVTSSSGDNGNGSGMDIRSSAYVKVYNNTVQRAASKGIYVGSSDPSDRPQHLDIRNNVLHGQASDDLDFGFPLVQLNGLTVDFNHYVSARVNGETLIDWVSAGYEKHATSGDPFVDARGLPLENSPLLDSGTTLGYLYGGATPDRGWGEFSGMIPLTLPGPWRIHIPIVMHDH